jgi:hypothetical protein
MTTNICPHCGGWTCCGNHKHGAQCRCEPVSKLIGGLREPVTDPLPFTATGPDVFRADPDGVSRLGLLA